MTSLCSCPIIPVQILAFFRLSPNKLSLDGIISKLMKKYRRNVQNYVL